MAQLHRFRILALVALGVMTLPVAAQPAGPDSNNAAQGVYVRDSAVAGEKLALASRMEHLKEWNKAADIYQEIIEKYADRVVPVPGSPDDAKRYSSVTLTVQDLLGKWPDEGLRAYKARFEAPAQSLLDAAHVGDVDEAAELSKVIQQYFPTQAALSAGMRLIELDIERGEFAAAAWLGQRLLDHHPALGQAKAELIFRTALAEHLGGESAQASARLKDLSQNFPAARGRFEGHDVVLAEALAQITKSAPAVAHGLSPDSWPTFGGDGTRGRVPDAEGRPGARLVEIPLTHPKQRPIGNAQLRGQINALEKLQRESGATLGIMPAVDRGEIFYQDNRRVYARGLESGFAVPGWATTYGDDDDTGTRYASPGGPILPTSTQLTVTLTENSVLAVLGQPDRVTMGDEGVVAANAASETELVCLDRVNGLRRWAISPRQFPQPLANLRELTLGGAPLVVGDNVYVAARGGKPMQFEDSYVLCFNLADGKLRWACYLASGNAQVDYSGVMPTSVISHLAYSGGRVYCVSNLGAVAAVDAYSGTISWLTLYPRPARNPNQFLWQLQRGQAMSAAQAGMKKPWTQNPAIVRDGRVYAMPADADSLFVYDAGTGQELKRVAMIDFDNADTLLGIVDGKVILASARAVYCIDWEKYKPDGAPRDCIEWVANLGISGTADQNKDTVRGRGFLTRDSLFICNSTNLKRIDLKTGRQVESYPADGPFGSGEGPGNVIATSDQIIIAGADSIDVYSDLSLARARLDKAVASAPKDPLPRLKYAETLFAAGQAAPAIEKLDEAIQLLGGLKAMRVGPDRDRAFARSLAFAERLADPKQGASDPSLASGLYDRAAAAAYSPAQQVAYRLSRAKFARQQRDFKSEVRLLEEILLNGDWRKVSAPAEDGSGSEPAGVIAEAQIAERIRDYPSAYQPFEIDAAAALASATQANDADKMLAVAQMYPNSKVAPAAMLGAAGAFEAAHDPRKATQVLNLAYRKYKDSPDKARIIEAQARNYLLLPGGVPVAIGRLNEGIKAGLSELQKPLRLPDGTAIQNVTFGAAVEILQHYNAKIASAALPEFNFPPGGRSGHRTAPFVPEKPQWVIDDVDALVVPPRELRDLGRHDRVVTWSKDRGLCIYAVGSNKPLVTIASMKDAQPNNAAWIDKDLLVWTDDAISLIKDDGNQVAWSAAISSLPKVQVTEQDLADADVAAPAAGGQINVQANGGPVFLGGNGGQAVIINGQLIRIQPGGALRLGAFGGRVRFMRAAAAGGQAAEQIDDVRPLGERIILDTTDGRIAALDRKTGQLAWQTRVNSGGIDQLEADNDFVAARWNDEYGAQLAAFDAFSGQSVYRRTFGPDSGTAPLNMALSPDGALIWTLPDRVCAKDLYEPGKTLRFGDSALAEGSRLFDGAIGPDQLLVAEGRVLAVADQGQFIRVLSLESGREIARPLATGVSQNDWNVWLRVVGPRVYVFNSHNLNSYDLDRLERSWSSLPSSSATVLDAFVGRRHVVLVSKPGDPGANQPIVLQPAQGGNFNGPPQLDDKPVRALELVAYGRYPSRPGRDDETGRIDLDEPVREEAGIDPRWQAVEGGFYYRSGDNKAHFLKGSFTPDDHPAATTRPASE